MKSLQHWVRNQGEGFMKLNYLRSKSVILLGSLIVLLSLFQNCSPSSSYKKTTDLTSTNQLSTAGDSPATGVSTTAQSFSPTSPSINIVYQGDTNSQGTTTPTMSNSDVTLTPEQLLNLPSEVLVPAPENCEATCIEQMGCETNNVADTDRQQCRNACQRDTGLCKPYELTNDPYVLTSFTVPAGYKKAKVILEHCTDRQDVLIIEGPSMHFKTMNPAMLHVGNGWSNMQFLGANVGRGMSCAGFNLRDIARVKMQTQDESGNFGAQVEKVWKMPGALGFSFQDIPDIDLSKPIFVDFKSVSGPGIKLEKIYDNNLPNHQLSFLVEYMYWYDPKYTTEFDLWYKKAQPL